MSIQDGHEDGKPELLDGEQRVGIGSPFSGRDII